MKRRALLFAIAAVAALAQCKRVPEPGATRSTEMQPAATATTAGAGATAKATSSAARGVDGSPQRAEHAVTGGEPGRAAPSADPVVGRAEPIGESERRGDAGAAGSTVRFAVVGDYGTPAPPAQKVATMVKSWNPEFVITLGDNNYPAGEATTIDANIGRSYSDFIGNYRGRYGSGSKTNRFWPSPGNHDWLSGLTPYTEYFSLPGNERYYDVDLGLVHLFALDSDAHEPDGIAADSRQAMWLKERLASSKACFDVVYFHHPAYTTAAHGPTLAMRWPFRAWGAEVVLAGHDHTYERFLIDEIPYFVNGLGGESTYDFAGDPAPETKFRYSEQHGAMRVTATRAGITYEFFTIDGQRRDTFTFAKRCAP